MHWLLAGRFRWGLVWDLFVAWLLLVLVIVLTVVNLTVLWACRFVDCLFGGCLFVGLCWLTWIVGAVDSLWLVVVGACSVNSVG